MNNKHVVLGVTGSIAAYKAADIIRQLQKKGLRVSVVMSKTAEKFITPLTLATLCDNKVYRAMFDEKQADKDIEHVDLAKDADIVLIAPATANVIGKIASGIADDLLTCIVMATKAPVLIAPAMNDGMYANKILQSNCKKLQGVGVEFVDPAEGELACGTIGKGRLAEIDDIIAKVCDKLA